MKEIVIQERDAGQRLDKYLQKYLSGAGKSFLYKMLRKKNITLNGKKAQGNEKLQKADCVRLFFSEETISKFTGSAAQTADTELDIIYEDGHVLVINKPAGMLSQKASKSDISLVEYLTGYLVKNGEITPEELKIFHPAVCNRLDRNTSGLVFAGKTVIGLQQLSEMLKNRTMHKYYLCLVKGQITSSKRVSGYLVKDRQSNQSFISETEDPDAQQIETAYEPIETGKSGTLLKVELITGRSHQIRSHLASMGHPIAGDSKYGDPEWNRYLNRKYRLNHQLLHAWQTEFPIMQPPLDGLSGKVLIAPLPVYFQKILEQENLSRHMADIVKGGTFSE